MTHYCHWMCSFTSNREWVEIPILQNLSGTFSSKSYDPSLYCLAKAFKRNIRVSGNPTETRIFFLLGPKYGALYWIRYLTGSQCNSVSNGVMWQKDVHEVHIARHVLVSLLHCGTSMTCEVSKYLNLVVLKIFKCLLWKGIFMPSITWFQTMQRYSHDISVPYWPDTQHNLTQISHRIRFLLINIVL